MGNDQAHGAETTNSTVQSRSPAGTEGRPGFDQVGWYGLPVADENVPKFAFERSRVQDVTIARVAAVNVDLRSTLPRQRRPPAPGVTALGPSRLLSAKFAYTTRHVERRVPGQPEGYRLEAGEAVRPRPPDVTQVGRLGQHSRIGSPASRRVVTSPGHKIVVAYGHRAYAGSGGRADATKALEGSAERRAGSASGSIRSLAAASNHRLASRSQPRTHQQLGHRNRIPDRRPVPSNIVTSCPRCVRGRGGVDRRRSCVSEPLTEGRASA
jgi:hypothetical protein